MLLHEEEDEDEESYLPVFHTSCVNFLHAVTFLHVLHLDVLRGEIEIEKKLCMAIMLDHPYIHRPSASCACAI